MHQLQTHVHYNVSLILTGYLMRVPPQGNATLRTTRLTELISLYPLLSCKSLCIVLHVSDHSLMKYFHIFIITSIYETKLIFARQTGCNMHASACFKQLLSIMILHQKNVYEDDSLNTYWCIDDQAPWFVFAFLQELPLMVCVCVCV